MKGVWLTVFFSVVLNIAGNFVALVNPDLSLHLDMIGTIIASVILGPLWGMGTGIFTNLINSYWYQPLLYYTSVNVIGGLYWGILAQFGYIPLLRNSNMLFPETDTEVLKKAAIVIVILGAVGGAITWLPACFLQTKGVNSSWFSYASVLPGNIYARYFTGLTHSVPDKILTAVMGVMIASFLFRFSAVRLTEAYCSDRHTRKSFYDAFIYDTKGLIFMGLASALYIAKLFKTSGSSSINLEWLLSAPSVFLPLLWFVPVPLAGGIARCFAEKREEPLVAMVNEDLGAPDKKLFILIIAGMAYWFIFWSAKVVPRQYHVAASSAVHLDVFLIAALLLLIMIFLLQDWRNSHLQASIREAKIKEEIAILDTDRLRMASEVDALQRNLEEWKSNLDSAKEDSIQSNALAEELFEELTRQFEQHKKVIQEKDDELMQKQALLDSHRKPGVAESGQSMMAGKREVILLKILFPHLKFHHRAVKEVSKGIGHDHVKKRTVTSLLHMLNEGKSLQELCDKYGCNEMFEARKGTTKTYRLKEGRCRIYFYLPPSKAGQEKDEGEGNINAEIISVMYDKKTQHIPDHVKEASPSWA